MARQMQRLSTKSVGAKRQSGYYADGGGLYLQVTAAGHKSWLFMFRRHGKRREMGLGPEHTVTLAQARTKAMECRELLLKGVDPIEARDMARAEAAVAAARSITFNECAASLIKSRRAHWKNEKHAAQWQSTLDTYCGPVFGSLPVAKIDTALIVKALEPIWATKPETATRLRARIERVLDWAAGLGYRPADNPARWRGHLDKVLPGLKKSTRVKHHPALQFGEVYDFMASLRAQEGIAARALEFLILTATRTSEVIGATWDEINLQDAVWTIPGDRMKAHREHRVPLSPQAATLLQTLKEQKLGRYVFPGATSDKPLSNMAMLQLLARMKRDDITVHGFRSTFRDWAAERTSYAREVCEMALAHVVRDQTEAAYRRGDLFEKRTHLMNDWARYCDTKPGAKVIPIQRTSASA